MLTKRSIGVQSNCGHEKSEVIKTSRNQVFLSFKTSDEKLGSNGLINAGNRQRSTGEDEDRAKVIIKHAMIFVLSSLISHGP